MYMENKRQAGAIPVFEISRMAIHNGPGMRTMVHLKGCPLRCVWCSTPESQSGEFELTYASEKCISCGTCVRVCPEGAMRAASGGGIRFDRARCMHCGLCAGSCCSKALHFAGRNYDARQLFEVIMKDRIFYETSGGGVTFSGGEPLQSVNGELLELLSALKREKVSVIFDTSGFVSRESLDQVLPYTDCFLWDLKQMDSALHEKYTGVGNEKTLRNLTYVDQQGAATYLRCPLITGINDNDAHIDGILRLAEGLTGVKEIDLLPLHHLGSARYERMGLQDAFAGINPPEESRLQEWKNRLEETGIPTRIIH